MAKLRISTREREDDQMATALWRMDVIRPILEYPKGSPERRRMIEEIARKPPEGLYATVKPVSVQTLYVWVKAYESGGIAALVPVGVRHDAGKPRVIVTTTWEAFFAGKISTELHERIARDLKIQIANLAQTTGRLVVSRLATCWLLETSLNLGVEEFEALPEGEYVTNSIAATKFGVCLVNRYATVHRFRRQAPKLEKIPP